MLLDVGIKFLFAVMLLTPLEHLLPRKDKAIFRDKWVTDLLYMFGGVFLISSIVTGILMIGILIFKPLVAESVQVWVSSSPLLLQIIAIMIIADIGYYLIHRAHHEIPFLWKFHAIHHSIEEMDWLAAHRVHPFDQALTRGVSLVPVFVLGFSPVAVGVWGFLFTWHSLLKHSNIKISFGPLRWLLVEPVFHHWHHANEEHAFDKNYAGQLPILDILFGTAIMENRKGPEVYGTDTYVPDDFIGQLVDPIKTTLLSSDEGSSGLKRGSVDIESQA